MTTDQKMCVTCKVTKERNSFSPRPRANGKVYLRSSCKGCENERRSKADKDRDYTKRNALLKEQRRSGEYRAKFLLCDTKSSDKKAGRKCDLTLADVEKLIMQSCFYCGLSDCVMTLDRINNDLGHTLDNVHPCCYRCNMIRGSMPYDAWVSIVGAIRKTCEDGLFGDWALVPIARRK